MVYLVVDLFFGDKFPEAANFLRYGANDRFDHIFFHVTHQLEHPPERFRYGEQAQGLAGGSAVYYQQVIFTGLVVLFDVGEREEFFHTRQYPHFFDINPLYALYFHEMGKVFTNHLPIKVQVPIHTDFLTEQVFGYLYRGRTQVDIERVSEAVGGICRDDKCLVSHFRCLERCCRSDRCFADPAFSREHDVSHGQSGQGVKENGKKVTSSVSR